MYLTAWYADPIDVIRNILTSILISKLSFVVEENYALCYWFNILTSCNIYAKSYSLYTAIPILVLMKLGWFWCLFLKQIIEINSIEFKICISNFNHMECAIQLLKFWLKYV